MCPGASTVHSNDSSPIIAVNHSGWVIWVYPKVVVVTVCSLDGGKSFSGIRRFK